MKPGIFVVLFLSFLIPTSVVGGADGPETSSRNQILREHHHLMSQVLVVMKDTVQMTQKLLEGKASSSDRKAIKKKLADMVGEVDEMISKHDGLMKSFDEITQKREAKPDKAPETLPE